jgi:mannitol-specific phosphotransferase system IIBC component
MVDRLRYERENENMKYQQAAICLQKHVRRFLATRYVERIKTRQSLSPIDHEKRRYSEETAAIIIQCQIRKFLASRRVSKIRAHREAIQQIRERHAAVVIQRFYRTHRNRQFELAAIKLQSHIRKFLALRRYKKMKSSMKKNDQTVEVSNLLFTITPNLSK